MGVSTQFRGLPPAETRRADATLLAALLAWRAGGLLTGAAALAAGGARYRSRMVTTAQLGIAIGESVWFGRRAGRRDRWSDATGSAIDAVTAATLVAVGGRNLLPADRVTWLNWAPWSLGENVLCGQAMADNPAALRIAGAVLVAGAHVQQGPGTGDWAANLVAHTAFFTIAGAFADHIRAGAVRLDEAREAAVHEGELLAAARERAAQLRLLHDSAVQTLEAIASGRETGHRSVTLRAADEAATLRRELGRPARTRETFAELLAAVVADAGGGLRVDVRADQVPAVPWLAAQALAGACREALTNVAKHSGVDRATVMLRAAGPGVFLEISDEGAGFDMTATDRGFGTVHSIQQRLADAGGRAELHSAPGAGTRVVVRWPA